MSSDERTAQILATFNYLGMLGQLHTGTGYAHSDGQLVATTIGMANVAQYFGQPDTELFANIVSIIEENVPTAEWAGP